MKHYSVLPVKAQGSSSLEVFENCLDKHLSEKCLADHALNGRDGREVCQLSFLCQ